METDDLTSVWKALSDPSRRKILDLLREIPRTTGEIAAEFEYSRAAAIKHLGLLRRCGLIVVRKQGRQRWNHLNAVPLRRIYERWLSPYEGNWAGSLVGLKRWIEQSNEGRRDMPSKKAVAGPTGPVTIEQEVRIEAAPSEVFKALTADIGAWWGPPHVREKDLVRDIVLEPRLGGRFYEDWGGGDGFTWAVVTGLRKNKLLHLTGPIGSRLPILTTAQFTLEAKDGGTLLKLSHHAIGEIGPEMQEDYSKGWAELLGTRLKAWVERGERSGIRN